MLSLLRARSSFCRLSPPLCPAPVKCTGVAVRQALMGKVCRCIWGGDHACVRVRFFSFSVIHLSLLSYLLCLVWPGYPWREGVGCRGSDEAVGEWTIMVWSWYFVSCSQTTDAFRSGLLLISAQFICGIPVHWIEMGNLREEIIIIIMIRRGGGSVTFERCTRS